MDFTEIGAAKRRLDRHMRAETPFERVKDKMDITMWSEEPLVICDMTLHTQCGQCFGVIQQLHKIGLTRITYQSEDEAFFKGPRPLRG